MDKWVQVVGVIPVVGDEAAVVAAVVAVAVADVAAKNHVEKYPVSSFSGNKPIANQTSYLCP